MLMNPLVKYKIRNEEGLLTHLVGGHRKKKFRVFASRIDASIVSSPKFKVKRPALVNINVILLEPSLTVTAAKHAPSPVPPTPNCDQKASISSQISASPSHPTCGIVVRRHG